MRRKAKLDLNHAEIVQAFERLGAKVLSLAPMGKGVPDLIVNFRNRLRFVEVKSKNGKLTPAQEEFMSDWPVSVVRSVDDVIEIVGEK